MTDTTTVSTETSTPTEPIATTSDSNQVSQPLNTSKPYDDDMFESYTAEPEVEAEKPKSEAVSEKVKEEEASEEVPAETPQVPKATKNDKVIDGLEELPIKRLINGKEVEFKIKDAIQSHIKQEEFNRNMDRRITEISRREKAWQTGQADFKGKISEIIEATQSGDFVTGIRALAKLAKGSSDLDVTQFEKMYFEQLEGIRDVYTKMTPEQRDAYFAKRSAAEAKAEAERLRGEKALTEAQSQLQEQVDALQKQHGLPPEEFWGSYKYLSENQVGEGKLFKTSDEITPEKVVTHSLSTRHWEKVFKAGESAGITDEAILDEVGRITESRQDLTVEDIVKLIKNAGLASPSVVENLNRKAGQPRFNSTASSTKKENVKGIDKEDLDFLYRKQPKAYSRIVR